MEDNIYISFKQSLEQYIVITDYCKDLDVKFENEIIHVHIKEAQRHFTKNNVINMDFIEI